MIAEITASAFQLTLVPPLLGRSLVDADERAGAQPVAVIGYDVWQSRFAGDPRVVGRTVRLGPQPTIVVGVMPEGFAFPVAHSLWVPLRLNPLDYQRRQGPQIGIFGRLAPGATLAQAQAELTTIGLRAAADFPDTHAQLRPEVVPYARSILDLTTSDAIGLMAINVFIVMLVVLLCGNVALLIFARAATRESEIVVRTALGAGRGRIVAQLFAEALVLTAGAAVVGLLAAGFALRRVIGTMRQDLSLPFWFSDSLAPATLLYTAVLAVLGGRHHRRPAGAEGDPRPAAAPSADVRRRRRSAVWRSLDGGDRVPGGGHARLPGDRFLRAARCRADPVASRLDFRRSSTSPCGSKWTRSRWIGSMRPPWSWSAAWRPNQPSRESPSLACFPAWTTLNAGLRWTARGPSRAPRPGSSSAASRLA